MCHRLQQQISHCQEIGGTISREPHQHSKNDICQIWYTQKNNVRCFVSDRFQQFCKTINIEQAVSLAYHLQSNGQVKACIKFITSTFKKCANLGREIYMALLQIHTMLLGPGLLSLATLMFNRQV